MIAVVSQSVEAIGWRNSVLHVRYKSGKTFMYREVPESIFKRALASESVGAFLHRNVKAHFPHTSFEHAPNAG